MTIIKLRRRPLNEVAQAMLDSPKELDNDFTTTPTSIQAWCISVAVLLLEKQSSTSSPGSFALYDLASGDIVDCPPTVVRYEIDGADPNVVVLAFNVRLDDRRRDLAFPWHWDAHVVTFDDDGIDECWRCEVARSDTGVGLCTSCFDDVRREA